MELQEEGASERAFTQKDGRQRALYKGGMLERMSLQMQQPIRSGASKTQEGRLSLRQSESRKNRLVQEENERANQSAAKHVSTGQRPIQTVRGFSYSLSFLILLALPSIKGSARIVLISCCKTLEE